MFVYSRRAALTAAALALPLVVFAGAARADPTIGWVWADQPSKHGTYTPNLAYSYNSNHGDVEITNGDTGVAVVTFQNLKSSDPTNVLVTAYETNGYCAIGGWQVSGDDETATVRCFDAEGAPKDQRFELLYQGRSGTFGNAAQGLAFLWADQPTAASYTPDAGYQFNSTGGTNTITRSGVGAYTVNIPGFDKVGGHVQVSAYGQTAARCKVADLGQDSDGAHVGVICFDKTGTAADQQFSLAFVRDMSLAFESADRSLGAYAWANKPKDTKTYKVPKPYQFNDVTKGKLTAILESKGQYSVVVPGDPDFDSSNMLVTAYGSDSSYCSASDWLPMLVNCYAQGGKLANTEFMSSFQAHH